MEKQIGKAIDLSCLAYQEPVDIEAEIHGEYEDFTWIENTDTDTQAFICRDEDAAWVTFRGTEFDGDEPFKDMETDLDFYLVPGHFGKEHMGFGVACGSVFSEITSNLIKYRLDNTPIYVAGHSLGGGVATNFCARALFYKNPVSKLITLGEPRNMDRAAAHIFGTLWGENCHAVVNNNDIVTRIPPRILGYRHVSGRNLYYLDEDGNLHTDISLWEKFKDRVKGRLYDFGELGTDGVKDHSSAQYKKAWSNATKQTY